MHDNLWAGVELKLENARFHFEKMGQSLGPPENTHMNAVLQSAGAIIDTRWQRSFYAYLSAFLSTTRSVAEVIKCCFGHDTAWQMKKWFVKLPSDEQNRRRKFSKHFKKYYDAFAKLPLSTARHISMRNSLAHGYFLVDPVLVWGTVQNDIPLLKKQVADVLKNYATPPSNGRKPNL